MGVQKKIVEVEVEQMSFGPDALGTQKGKKIFIPWGVPGDRLKIEIVEEKKDFSRGKILEILEKSPHRTSPPCSYFFKCGGCQWQHIRYSSQLDFKNGLLREALQRIGKISPPLLKDPIPALADLHYRNRIRLQVSRGGEVGFFRHQSKQVVPIDSCLIADERLNERIPETKKVAGRLLEADRAKLHEIEIRIEGDKVVLQPDPSGETAFSQVNIAQNDHLRQLVLETLELQGNERVLELYAGEGNFIFALAKQCSFLIAVESHSDLISRAQQKIKEEHRKNIEFIESTTYHYLESTFFPSPPVGEGIRRRRRGEGEFDRLLLDPPRRGALECLEGIARLQIPILVYVSCDPSTLARDVKILQELGYRHDFSQVIDMFPQTYHVESVTRMKKNI